MRKNIYIFGIITLFGAYSCGNKKQVEVASMDEFKELNVGYQIPKNFDIQGHRIAKGLAPENSLFAIPIALQIPSLTTLELDLAITRDKKVILSHDPWLSSELCDHPNDDRIMPYEDEKIIMYNMDYSQIMQYRCGGRLNKDYLKQRLKYEPKPLLDVAIAKIKEECLKLKRPFPQLNIEIKSAPEWDNFYTPKPAEYVKLVLEVIHRNEIESNVLIQSFDPRSLEEVRKQNPNIPVSLLGKKGSSWTQDKASLSFKPEVYSPHYSAINTNLVEEIKKDGIKVIPYTVNDSLQIGRIIESGCDGIISDYPDLVQRVIAVYK